MVRKERRNITEELYNLAIIMVQSEKNTLKEIASTLEISVKTLGRIIKKHESGKEFISANKNRKNTADKRNDIFSELDQSIYNSLSINNSLVQREIADDILIKMNTTVSQPTISRKIKKMNFTRKRLVLVPEERNTSEKLDLRAIYAVEFSRISDENLVFLDETGFNQHTRRSYGYSMINTKAYINVPANKNINRSLICAIGLNGVIGYQYKLGAYNSDGFINFLSDKIVPFFEAHKNKILVMDNAKIHKSILVREFLDRKKIVYKFLVPYSPELNPIEEFFAMIKAKFSSLRILNPISTIEECIDLIFTDYNEIDLKCACFFKNMRIWLEKARRREIFI